MSDSVMPDPPRGENIRVAIIGGGVTGCLTAARLQEAGCDVTLIEKGRLGNGASSSSAACIRAQFGVPETVIGMRYCRNFYANIVENLPTRSMYLEPVLTSNGYLFLYENPVGAKNPDSARLAWDLAQKKAAVQQDLGLPVEICTSGEEINEEWPYINPDKIIGGTFCPEDGFLVPDLIYNQAAAHAKAYGAEFHLQTEVFGMRHRNGSITHLETNKGPIAADVVINATNIWANQVSQMLGGMELKIEALKRFLYFLTPNELPIPEADWERMPFTIYGLSEGRGAYSKPEGDKLMVAWAHQTDHEDVVADHLQDYIPPEFHHREFDGLGYQALAQVAEFAPTIGNCGGLSSVTCGYYDNTPDHNPYIGWDSKVDNLIHAAGFSGHGLMMAPMSAYLIEQLLSRGRGAQDSMVYLPPPYDICPINMRVFHPDWLLRKSIPEPDVI